MLCIIKLCFLNTSHSRSVCSIQFQYHNHLAMNYLSCLSTESRRRISYYQLLSTSWQCWSKNLPTWRWAAAHSWRAKSVGEDRKFWRSDTCAWWSYTQGRNALQCIGRRWCKPMPGFYANDWYSWFSCCTRCTCSTWLEFKGVLETKPWITYSFHFFC